MCVCLCTFCAPRNVSGRESANKKFPGPDHSLLPISFLHFVSFHFSPAYCLFELLLGSQLGGVSALFLAAVCGLGGKTGVALAADGLFAVVLSGKHGQRRIVNSSSQSKDQVKSGLLLDVVVAQSAAIFQLLSGKDKTLLIRRDSFLILDLSLDVVDGVRRLDIKGDGLTREGLYEDLHGR
mgnify:CR=1 FL=1